MGDWIAQVIMSTSPPPVAVALSLAGALLLPESEEPLEQPATRAAAARPAARAMKGECLRMSDSSGGSASCVI
jgi:hypothetical protein